jgi:ABC-type branched-subunit amino acid transport system ATPase component
VSIILKVENIGVSFGGLQALLGVSLDIRRGEILGVIGRTVPAKPPCSTSSLAFMRHSKAASSSTVAT